MGGNERSSGVELRELRKLLGKGQIINGFVGNIKEFQLYSDSRRAVKGLKLGVWWSAVCSTEITLVAVRQQTGGRQEASGSSIGKLMQGLGKR